MSWDGWGDHLKGDDVLDCAIVGFLPGTEAVWCSSPGLAAITAAEIKMLVSTDRSPLFSGKLTVAGVPCTVLRDQLGTEPFTMDIKTKATDADPDKYSIAISKTRTALLVCKGKKDTHGGVLNKKVYDLAEKLKAVGC